MKIYWQDEARFDMESIFEYYSKEVGSDFAKNRLNKIYLSANLLEDFPYISRKVSHDMYEHVVSNTPYILPYVIYKDGIYVLRVFDSRQKPTDWDKEKNKLYQNLSKQEKVKQELQLSRVKRLNAEKEKGKSK